MELYDPPHDRRAFSPADTSASVVGAGLVLVGILVSVVAQETVKGVEEDLVEAFNRLPDALESFVLSLAQLVTAFVPAVAIVVLVLRRRLRVALLLLLAGGIANVLMVVADAFVIDRRLADALDQVRDQRDLLGGASYPSSAVLAATTAVVTVAAPWVSRRWRRTLWWGVAILALLRLLAVAEPAFDLILALGIGTVVGSLVLLVFGSPSSEPGPPTSSPGCERSGCARGASTMPHARSGPRCATSSSTGTVIATTSPSARPRTTTPTSSAGPSAPCGTSRRRSAPATRRSNGGSSTRPCC